MIDENDLTRLRREFPVTETFLYLDSAHQAPLSRSVGAAIEAFLDEALRAAGPKTLWMERVAKVRARLAAFIGADPQEVAFTRNTSEGLNAVANALPMHPGDNVVMLHGDHPNLTYAFLNQRRRGIESRFVMTDGHIDGSSFADLVDGRTRAIAVSHVTFHSGCRFDIADVGRLCEEHGIALVVDATQSVGVMPLDVKAARLSFVACSTHKGLLVPHGLGFLFVDAAQQGLAPAYLSTASLADPPPDLLAQPDNLAPKPGAGGFEYGNHNIMAIHALSASFDLIESVGREEIETHVLDLGDHLIGRLDALGIGIVGPRERSRRSHIYVLDLPEREWVPFLRANGARISPERGCVRVSFGMFSNVDDVEQLIALLRRGCDEKSIRRG